MSTIYDNLKRIGLVDTEAEIYELLANIGPCFVAPLVRQTKKHRQIIYNALDGLIKKKFVSVSRKNGKNFYAIAEPIRFVEEAQRNLLIAKQLKQNIEAVVKTDREIATIFSGSNSYEQGLADFRNKAAQSKEYIVIGGQSEEWYEYAKLFWEDHVTDLRRLKRLGVDICILFYERDLKSAVKNIKPHIHDPYNCKIADEIYRLPQTIWLSGEYVYFLTPTFDPLVISVKSETLAETYRHYFKEQWSRAKTLSR